MDGSLHLRHETREVDIPLNTSRNSLQVEARILMVKMSEEAVMQGEQSKNPKEDEEDEVRVFALTGYLSRYVKDLEVTPGWHRLPNGVAVYSDPVATQMIGPSDSIEKMYKSRLTMVKGKDGMWTQLENIEDYTTLGERAFRRISLTNEPEDIDLLLDEQVQGLLGEGIRSTHCTIPFD